MIAKPEEILAKEAMGYTHIVWRDNSYFVATDIEESRQEFCEFLTNKSGNPWKCYLNNKLEEERWVFYREDQFEVVLDLNLHITSDVDGEIDLPLNTSSYNGMFYKANFETPKLIVHPLEMRKVKYMIGMFCNCKQLKQIDISKWDVSSVKDKSSVFILQLPDQINYDN